MNVAGMLAIVNIGQLVTLAGPARPRFGKELRELGIVENAALLVDDGRIHSAGPYSQLRSQIPAGAAIIDAEGCCVTPGFVDAHTHLVFAGNRAEEFEQRIAGATYQEIAAAGGGILRTVRLTRAASKEELFKVARRRRTGCFAPAQLPSRPNQDTDWSVIPSCACCACSRDSIPRVQRA